MSDTTLPDSSPIPSPASAQSDPLIDHSGQLAVYIGTALLILGIAAAVGFFSRRVEHALFTALFLSLFLIAFWAFTR